MKCINENKKNCTIIVTEMLTLQNNYEQDYNFKNVGVEQTVCLQDLYEREFVELLFFYFIIINTKIYYSLQTYIY